MGRFSLVQRAYTFCLKGVPPEFYTRRKFWETHEIVNKGVRAFGNWLLTLRGGISHELADKLGREKARQTHSACSFLVIGGIAEGLGNDAKKHIVEKDKNGKQKTVEALEAVLQS